jgi:hypothetical protein
MDGDKPRLYSQAEADAEAARLTRNTSEGQQGQAPQREKPFQATRNADKRPTPTVKGAGKIADVVPEYVPPNWTADDVRGAIEDYQRSIAVRRAEQQAFEEEGGGEEWRRKDHYERIVEEENFLRQLQRRLKVLAPHDP